MRTTAMAPVAWNLMRVLTLTLGLLLPGTVGAAFAQESSPQRDLDVESLLRLQNARLDSLLDPESARIDTAGIHALADSLDREGYDRARRLHPRSFGPPRLRFRPTPLALTTYNRVDGLRTGSGVDVRYGRQFGLEAAGAWGTKSHRWSGKGSLRIGLPTRGVGAEIAYGDLVLPFGPDADTPSNLAFSWIAGQDRHDYLRRRDVEARIHLIRRRDGNVSLTGFHRRDRSEPARTAYSLFQGHGRPIEAANPPVDQGTWNGIEGAARWAVRSDLLEFRARAGYAGGETDYPWVAGGVTLRPVFPDGGILSLSIDGHTTGSEAPYQAQPFLGGDANLRGYRRLEFRGRSRISARAEYAVGLDLLGRMGVPLLGQARLQFIPFFDVGTTLGDFPAGGSAEPSERADRSLFLDGTWKSSAGLGIRRDLWFPGLESVRLDIIHRNDGAVDPWSFWFRVVKLVP